ALAGSAYAQTTVNGFIDTSAAFSPTNQSTDGMTYFNAPAGSFPTDAFTIGEFDFDLGGHAAASATLSGDFGSDTLGSPTAPDRAGRLVPDRFGGGALRPRVGLRLEFGRCRLELHADVLAAGLAGRRPRHPARRAGRPVAGRARPDRRLDHRGARARHRRAAA